VIVLKPTYPLFGLALPGYVFLFVVMGIAQLILPRVSWQGHLAGIIVGLMVGGGAFEWFEDYLALCTLVWTLLAFIASIKLTGAREFPYIVIQDAQDNDRQDIRVVNGSVHGQHRMFDIGSCEWLHLRRGSALISLVCSLCAFDSCSLSYSEIVHLNAPDGPGDGQI
jgi:hypothetical protein